MIKYREKPKRRKLVTVTCDDKVYVGLDVHKRSIHCTVRVNGQLVATLVMPNDPDAVISTLKPLEPGMQKIVYEAGPTGYTLARALQKIRWPVEVIAAGKTPKEANKGSKSDGLDCKKLAEFAEKNLLKKVAIPTEQEEADRQLTRLRDHLKKKDKRVKQQIKSLLLQHGIKEPAGLKHWSIFGIKNLAGLAINPELRFVLDVYLEQLSFLQKQLKATEKRIQQLGKTERMAEKKTRLTTHPGVGYQTAMKYITEVYQPGRFSKSTEVACYTGLAPLIKQSGETRKEGPLIKAGQGPLRCLLVQGAWVWIRVDHKAEAVYLRLLRNTGCSQKAITAMARRMAINLWCMLTRGEDFRIAA